jgi:hypothetical protein
MTGQLQRNGAAHTSVRIYSSSSRSVNWCEAQMAHLQQSVHNLMCDR